MATFGERLAKAREKHGWTQQELADRAGIRYETINRIENGKHAEPRVYVAVALAKALGTTVDYLVGMYEDEAEDAELLPAAAAMVGA
jgi:transcriptional regulator with XRE-family HTH domain